MDNMRIMPILLLDEIVPYPKCNYTISIEDDEYVEAVKTSMGADSYLMLVNAKDYDKGVTENNIFRIGTVAKIKNAMRGLDGGIKLSVNCIERAYIDSVQKNSDYSLCQVESMVEISTADEVKVSASVDVLKDLFAKYRGVVPMLQPALINDVKKTNDLGVLCDKLCDKLVQSFEDKRAILEETDVYERALLTIALIEKEIQRANVKNDIMLKAKENIEEAQKEYFLREELKAINEELGDKSGTGEEIKGYREKMAELKMPEYAEEKLEKEFKRLERANPGTAEGSVIRDYIDNVLSLPWGNMTKENTSLKRAEQVLNKDHYGLEKVKERIVEYLAVRLKVDNPNAPILCLVGPPGVGKTSIAKSIARALGRRYVRMSLGGISDEAEIRGHRRTYLGAMPGRIISAVKQAGASNPLVLLDEIDKLGKDYKGDPAAAFLEVLDGEQNVNFRDNYIEMPYDLSRCLFLCTANSLDTIPGPLRDRLEIVELSSYTSEEKYHIAADYLVPKQLEANGLTKAQLKFRKDAIEDMIESYTREAGVRTLERTIGKVCRKVVKQQIEDGNAVVVSKKNLTDFLGKRIFKPETINATDEVGICKGLAWTTVGGTTLDVEVNILKGKGNFKITGNVGKVMEESYNAALSYIRANADELGVDIDFENTDVHIHIPEGATPKDGPSAGITMATAMVSAMTRTPIRADIAMTGEISIRGKVMPIGGLKEKVLAAKRAGVKKVIIPVENAPDLEEIPEYGKSNMEFVLASKMNDVLSNSLIR
ncbi:MAG: endopeptidase La [Clostridia bacterium]|nr:endopeptidase La [Clostridia bacterium]